MSRRPKNNFIADLIDLMAMLPWWICLALAAGSYYYLHDLASQPVQVATDVANMAQAAILRALVQGGQYIAPVLFLTAAGLSYFARAHRRELIANTRTRQRLETVPEDGDHTSQAHEQRSHSPSLQTSPPSPTHQPSRAPSCPECGSPMQQRKARKWPNTGQSFWGCTRYPACRGTR